MKRVVTRTIYLNVTFFIYKYGQNAIQHLYGYILYNVVRNGTARHRVGEGVVLELMQSPLESLCIVIVKHII